MLADCLDPDLLWVKDDDVCVCVCIRSAAALSSSLERDARPHARTGCTQGTESEQGPSRKDGGPKHAPQAWWRIARQQQRRRPKDMRMVCSTVSCRISFCRIPECSLSSLGVRRHSLTSEQTTRRSPFPFNGGDLVWLDVYPQ